jgi:hypothetical protein
MNRIVLFSLGNANIDSVDKLAIAQPQELILGLAKFE